MDEFNKDLVDTSAVKAAIKPGETESEASLSTSNMTRQEAFEVLSLKEDAKPEMVDHRFYNLTKRYRIEKDLESLERVTKAYEIASGRAAKKEEAAEEHETAKKYFGKTKREWNTYIYYSWWKYVLAALAVIFVVYAGNQMINGNNFDIRIVNIGHFKQDTQSLTLFAMDKLSYTNPYIVSADIGFADPSAADADMMDQSIMAFAYLSAAPDIVFFDEPTMPYFIDHLRELDGYYESLRLALPPEVFASIEPVRYSRMDSYKLRNVNPEEYSEDKDDSEIHIYGLRFNEAKLYKALGYSTKWQSGDKLVVMGIAVSTENIAGAEFFATEFIKNQDALIRQFEEVNGEIVVFTGVPTKEEETQDSETTSAA